MAFYIPSIINSNFQDICQKNGINKTKLLILFTFYSVGKTQFSKLDFLSISCYRQTNLKGFAFEDVKNIMLFVAQGVRGGLCYHQTPYDKEKYMFFLCESMYL